MRKRNSVNAIAAILFALVLLGGTVLFISVKNKTVPRTNTVKIYYYDPISMELVPETVNVKLPESEILKIQKITDILKTPGKNGLFPVLNRDAKINSVRVENSVCKLDIGKNATVINPYSVRKEAIRVYGIVNTLTELPEIKAVFITIDGKQQKYFSKYIEIDKPLTHLTSALPEGKDVFIYYGSPDLSKLIVQKRNILATQNPTELGKEILRELINGPFGVTLPEGTEINDFYIKSGGVGVANFNRQILKDSLGSQGEQTRVLAIVNSLTELPDIRSVRILVNGKEINTLYGSVDTSQPIPRFMGITEDPNTVVPYFTIQIDGKKFFTPQIKTVNKESKIKDLFDLLKSPPKGEETFINKSVKLAEWKISPENRSLTLKISVPSGEEENIPKIAEQVKLSYSEIPGISYVTIYINGEKQ